MASDTIPRPLCREPVAIIGSGDAAPDSPAYVTAYRVAKRLAEARIVVLCGGRTGIMEAAAKGARDGGGLSIGVLPSMETEPNPYLTCVLRTDLGKVGAPIFAGPPEVSRNRVIASAAICLVAVAGSAGTANEIAHALVFGKTVFGLAGAPDPAAHPPVPADALANYRRDLDSDGVVRRVLEICTAAG